jgi:hypothetical protein
MEKKDIVITLKVNAEGLSIDSTASLPVVNKVLADALSETTGDMLDVIVKDAEAKEKEKEEE